ncbi:hypothetical protein LAZ67_14000035 [Cordylochernes scorpioides]|uniref:GATOR complex protein NPRL3 n=1 Tax=Cordylochernes scorpioides TaxID=51811 RepID=A0ABY6L5A6_9ARAC|nr:hypothetical protein LAZ67_14000035 [Cordylochernes scorpioides]
MKSIQASLVSPTAGTTPPPVDSESSLPEPVSRTAHCDLTLDGFPDQVLAKLFACQQTLCGHSFELKVKDVRFVGHPIYLAEQPRNPGNELSCIKSFHVVFALRATANHTIVDQYHEFSKRIAIALKHEEERCGYLSSQAKTMLRCLDKMSSITETEGGHLSAYHQMLSCSTLANDLRKIYEDTKNLGEVHLRINKWIILSYCLPEKVHRLHNKHLSIDQKTLLSTLKDINSIRGGPRKSKPWFDKDCYDMKKLAKESLKKYRKTNRLEDRECYASSRKKYLALLDLKKKGFDNEKQEILRNAKDSKTFWKTIALYKSTSIIQGEISIQDWLNFYRELMTTEKNLRICNLHNVISQNDPILDSEITNADIYKEIAGLRSNKACGPDGIPNEVLKTLPDSYILLLKQLYNSVMTTGKYPAIWTNSTIHPIFKNGYKNSPSNYRGIALISNVSKLFTSILRSRLEEWVEGRRVIPENQAGFRKGRSCIDHIFTLTTLIQLSLRKKRGKLYVFFVDLRKAFDTVPHSILWKKLYNLGISYQFISTIKSYYEQATIAIRWKGSFTESIKINSGVLQGEPLSPLLFILFITDLIEIYNNSDLPSVNLPEFGDIHLLLYADDIAIIGESRMNLQKKIKILKEYLDENLMTLNESKSKIMVFRNGGKPSNKDRWFWNDKPITITSRYTYLGFPLTPTITTTHPANYFKGKALTAINATHPILIKSKAKSINLSTKLFDTIVRAVLMYAAPLWATEHKDLLDSIQDIFIRRFLNLPRYTPGYLIRLETGRISLSVTALKLTLKYWLRVLNMSSDRLPRICFNRTRELSNASGTPIGFIKKLTNLLNNNGSPALVSCDDPETLRSAITGLLKTAADQSIQNDLTRMDKSKLYSHYKDIHISFMTEGYLLGDFPFPVVRLLAQVRILSSFFRENHTKMLCGEDPTCTFCNSKLQNEITHYIFDCSALKEERRTLMLKTGQLCASLPSIIDNMTQNKYIATAFYGFHKSISQKKAK